MFQDKSLELTNVTNIADRISRLKATSIVVHTSTYSEERYLDGNGSSSILKYVWPSDGKVLADKVKQQCVVALQNGSAVELLPMECADAIKPLAFAPDTNAVLTNIFDGANASREVVTWTHGLYTAVPSSMHHSRADVDIMLESSGRLAVVSKTQQQLVILKIAMRDGSVQLVVINFDVKTKIPEGIEMPLTAKDQNDDVFVAVPPKGFSMSRSFLDDVELSGTDEISASKDELLKSSGISGIVELSAAADTIVKIFGFVYALVKVAARETETTTSFTCPSPAAWQTYDLREVAGLVLHDQVDFVTIDDTQYMVGEKSPNGITVTNGGSLIVNSKEWSSRSFKLRVGSGECVRNLTLTMNFVQGSVFNVKFDVPSGKTVHIPFQRVKEGIESRSIVPLTKGCSVSRHSFIIGRSCLGMTAQFSVNDDTGSSLGTISIDTSTNVHLSAATTKDLWVKRGSNVISLERNLAYIWFDGEEKSGEAYLTEATAVFKDRCAILANQTDITVYVDDLNASALPRLYYAIFDHSGSKVKNWHVVKLKMRPEAAHDDIEIPAGQYATLDLQSNDYNPEQVRQKVMYSVDGKEYSESLEIDNEHVEVSGSGSGIVEVNAKTDYTGSAFSEKVLVRMGRNDDDEVAELTVNIVQARGPVAHSHYVGVDGKSVSRGNIWSDAAIAPFPLESVNFESRTYAAGTVFYCSNGALVVSTDGHYTFSPNRFPAKPFAGLNDIVCCAAGKAPIVLSIQTSDSVIASGPYSIRAGNNSDSGKYCFNLQLPEGVEIKAYGSQPSKLTSAGTKVTTRGGTFKCDKSGNGKVECASGHLGRVYVLLTYKSATRLTTCEVIYTSNEDAIANFCTHVGSLKLASDTDRLLKYGIKGTSGTKAEGSVGCGIVSALGNSVLFVADVSGAYRMWISSAYSEPVCISYQHGTKGSSDTSAIQSEQILTEARAFSSTSARRAPSVSGVSGTPGVIRRANSPHQRALAVTFENSASGALVENLRQRSLSRGSAATFVTYLMYPEGTHLPNAVASQYAELLTPVKHASTGSAAFYTVSRVVETPTCIFRPVSREGSGSVNMPVRIVGVKGYSFTMPEICSHASVRDGSNIDVVVDDMQVTLTVKTDVNVETTLSLGMVIQASAGECEHYETRKIVLFPGSILPETIQVNPEKGVKLVGALTFASGKTIKHPKGTHSLVYANYPHRWTGQCTFVEDESVENQVLLEVGSLSTARSSRALNAETDQTREQAEHESFLNFVQQSRASRSIDVAPISKVQKTRGAPVLATRSVVAEAELEDTAPTEGFVRNRHIDSVKPALSRAEKTRASNDASENAANHTESTVSTLLEAPILARTKPDMVSKNKSLQTTRTVYVAPPPLQVQKPVEPEPEQPVYTAPVVHVPPPVPHVTMPIVRPQPAPTPKLRAIDAKNVNPVQTLASRTEQLTRTIASATSYVRSLVPAAEVPTSISIETMNAVEKRSALLFKTRDIVQTFMFVPIPLAALGNAKGVSVMISDICTGMNSAFFFNLAGTHTVLLTGADGSKRYARFDVKAIPNIGNAIPEVKTMPAAGFPLACSEASAIAYGLDNPIAGHVKGGIVKFAHAGPILARLSVNGSLKFIVFQP